MKDESKKNIFKGLFGQKSSCCSFDLEQIETTGQKSPDDANEASNCCCCSPSKPFEKKSTDDKK